MCSRVRSWRYTLLRLHRGIAQRGRTQPVQLCGDCMRRLQASGEEKACHNCNCTTISHVPDLRLQLCVLILFSLSWSACRNAVVTACFMSCFDQFYRLLWSSTSCEPLVSGISNDGESVEAFFHPTLAFASAKVFVCPIRHRPHSSSTSKLSVAISWRLVFRRTDSLSQSNSYKEEFGESVEMVSMYDDVHRWGPADGPELHDLF